MINDVEKLEKIWIVMPKGSRMPKANQVLINCPVMTPAADFSISNEQFTKDCTSRIGTMMKLFSSIISPAAAPKLQKPKKRRVVIDDDSNDDEDEKMSSTFASSPSVSSSTALPTASSTIEIQDDVRRLPPDYKNLLDELGFKL